MERGSNNLLLSERDGRTALGNIGPRSWQYGPNEAYKNRLTEGQYSPVRLELARLVGSLLYGTRAMLVLNLVAFESKKYKADDRFHQILPIRSVHPSKVVSLELLIYSKNISIRNVSQIGM